MPSAAFFSACFLRYSSNDGATWMACCFPFGSLGSTTVCGNCKGDQNTQRKRVEKSCQRLVRSHPHQDKHLPRSHRPPGSVHLHAQLEKGYTNAVRMEGNTYRLGVTGGLTCTHEEQPKSSGTEAEHNRAGATTSASTSAWALASASSYKKYSQTDNHGMHAMARVAHVDRSAQRVTPTYRRPTTCRPPAPCACGTPPGTRGPSRACP